jgi:hypothetical protein
LHVANAAFDVNAYLDPLECHSATAHLADDAAAAAQDVARLLRHQSAVDR